MEGRAVETIHYEDPKHRLWWFLGACALIAGVGLFADHVWWSGARGTSIAETVGQWIGIIIPIVAGLAFAALMLVAMVTWVIEAGSWVAGLVRRIYRFIRDHTWREIVGTVAPVVFSLTAFWIFSWVTEGRYGVGYWLLTGFASAVIAGGVGLVFGMVWPLLEMVGDGVGWLVALPWRLAGAGVAARIREVTKIAVAATPLVLTHGLVFVEVMTDSSFTKQATWGTYATYLVGVGTVVGSAWAGSALKRRWAPPAEPEEPEEDTEEEYWSPTAIPAWRAWGWTGEVLKGVWQPWTTSKFVAVCPECTEVPGLAHTCGVYAFKNVSDVVAMTGRRSGLVIGRVELSGLVIEHEKGYRAEEVKMVELMAPPSIAAAVQARYPDVPVRSRLLEGVSDG